MTPTRVNLKKLADARVRPIKFDIVNRYRLKRPSVDQGHPPRNRALGRRESAGSKHPTTPVRPVRQIYFGGHSQWTRTRQFHHTDFKLDETA